MRRLRSSDGVFFTKYGALNFARNVEHELSRYMSNRATVALPSGPVEPAPESKPAERPLAGPVVSLTGKPPKDTEELLGAPGNSSIHSDAIATKVLTKGETVAAPFGRADNFAWPQGSETQSAQSVPPAPVPATNALASAPAEIKPDARKKGGAGKQSLHTTKQPTETKRHP